MVISQSLLSRLKSCARNCLPRCVRNWISLTRATARRLLHRPRRWLTGCGNPAFGWPRGRREFDAFWKDTEVVEAYETADRVELDRAVLVLLTDRPRRLLDVGCGAGRFLCAAADRWPGTEEPELWGADFSKSAIGLASAALPAGKFICAPADALGLPDRYFHVIVCIETLEHIRVPERALAEIYRVLAPGGVLVICVPDGQKDETTCHVNFWSIEDLRNLLAAYGPAEIKLGPGGKNLIAKITKPAAGSAAERC